LRALVFVVELWVHGGRTNEHIQPAEFIDRGSHQIFHRNRVGHIHAGANGLIAVFFKTFSHCQRRAAIQIRDHDARAGLGQRAAKLFAKQPGAAGYNSYLAPHMKLIKYCCHATSNQSDQGIL